MYTVYGKPGETNPLNCVICWKVEIVVVITLPLHTYTFHNIDSAFLLVNFCHGKVVKTCSINMFEMLFSCSTKH
jgi:hypothetical protein